MAGYVSEMSPSILIIGVYLLDKPSHIRGITAEFSKAAYGS
jgi:hypothetical protein